MRISVNWLRELVDLTLTPEALAETLTIAGLEVEAIEDRRSLAEGVVVGKILARNPHPNADKLSVCTVDVGKESPLNIVCGAPNAAAEIYVPVAVVGTYLPTVDLKIKPAKLRGVPSEGMICSLAELGLAKESAGIHIFAPDKVKIGEDVRPLLGLDDVILEIMPTANRSDALSMLGIAREVAALTGAALHLPKPTAIPITDKALSSHLSLNIEDREACPTYLATAIAGVTIAPSPLWLQRRLESAGLRPINNVVDVTNYVLLEWGQPLHAFDRDRLQALVGSPTLTLGTRFAKLGESLPTLDGQTRNLTAQNLLITANGYPVAIAGVMGGSESEVLNQTQNIVLEAALFDPVTIRRSARAQNVRTEASARYERGVNFSEIEGAAHRALQLIIEVAGGQIVEQAIADARPDRSGKAIALRLDRIHQILGWVHTESGLGNIAASEVERILRDLGCGLSLSSENPVVWSVEVPAYRDRDLEREIDLIEEVARLYGYDRFADKLPDKGEIGKLSPEVLAERKIREVLRGVGLTEVVHYSLVKPSLAEVVIANPLLAEYAALRTNLLDGLIDAFENNLAQGNGAINAFEWGRTFRQGEEVGQPLEQDAIAGILGGDRFPEGQWLSSGKPAPLTWFEAKGLLDTAFARLGVNVEYQSDREDPRLHPGRTAALWLGKQRLGTFGQIHPQLRQERDLPEAVYVFDLKAEVLLDALAQSATPHFQPYSTYPAVERDLAFFAAKEIPVQQLQRVMSKAGGQLLAGITLFDDYQGQNVPEGQRSLAFSIAYRAGDRTLTDGEVEPVHNQIREALLQKFQVTLRS
jgi:phenylalanyl-tRNA synthetase beta chain